MNIWAGSWPRSGSTLFRIVWHTYTGLPTYSYANDGILAKASANQWIGQRPLPVPWKQMSKREDRPRIFLIKTHLHPITVDPNNVSRKLFLVRDCRDAAVSLAHYTSWRKKREFDKELQRVVVQSTWLDFANAWLPVARAMVRYEDLVQDPLTVLRLAIEDLGLVGQIPVMNGGVRLPSFGALHKGMPRFFRRGQVGAWGEYLSEAQEAHLWHRFGAMMEQLGYER